MENNTQSDIENDVTIPTVWARENKTKYKAEANQKLCWLGCGLVSLLQTHQSISIAGKKRRHTVGGGDKVSIGLWENYSAPACEESRSKATTASGWKINTELFFFCPAKKEEDKTVERGMSTGIWLPPLVSPAWDIIDLCAVVLNRTTTKSHPSNGCFVWLTTNLSSLKLLAAVVVVVVAGGASPDERNRIADDPKWLIKFDEEFDDDNDDGSPRPELVAETWLVEVEIDEEAIERL